MCHPFMVTVASCDAEGYMADKIFAIGGSAGLVVMPSYVDFFLGPYPTRFPGSWAIVDLAFGAVIVGSDGEVRRFNDLLAAHDFFMEF